MTSPASPTPNAQRIVIAIDGPAASGKSSTAHRVAERLHFRHIDSGALYRAATAAALNRASDPASWTAELVLSAAHAVTLAATDCSFVPHFNQAQMEGELRRAEVTANVSQVAQMQPVRDWVNALVKEVASRYDVVVDGRDMGTNVFPNADIKIYLVADPWERARRRLIQRVQRSPTDEEIAAETDRLVRRDA
ncbi:MAG: (d)CMP kinase, partial [Gemmatimonadota bacterium]